MPEGDGENWRWRHQRQLWCWADLLSPDLSFPLFAEVLDAWKKVENAVVSMSSVGLSVDSDASKEAESFVNTSQSLICELFPAIMATVQNEDDDVRLAPLGFLQTYANKLKNTRKRTGSLPEVSLCLLRQLLQRHNKLPVCRLDILFQSNFCVVKHLRCLQINHSPFRGVPTPPIRCSQGANHRQAY